MKSKNSITSQISSKHDIEKFDEEAFRRDVLKPLLHWLGHTNVKEVHSTNEIGRDLTSCKPDHLGTLRYYCTVAKAAKLTGKVGDEVVTQVKQCFENPTVEVGARSVVQTDHVIIAVNKNVHRLSRDKIESQLVGRMSQINWMDLDKVWEYWCIYSETGLITALNRTYTEKIASGMRPDDAFSVGPRGEGFLIRRLSDGQFHDGASDLNLESKILPLFEEASMIGKIGDTMSVGAIDNLFSRETSNTYSASFRIHCDDGDYCEIPHLELAATRSKSGHIVITNVNQGIPIIIRLTVSVETLSSSIELEVAKGQSSSYWADRWFSIIRTWKKSGHTEVVLNDWRMQLARSSRRGAEAEEAPLNYTHLVHDLALLERLVGMPILLPAEPNPFVVAEARHLGSLYQRLKMTGTWGSFRELPPYSKVEQFSDGRERSYSFDSKWVENINGKDVDLGRVTITLESAKATNPDEISRYSSGNRVLSSEIHFVELEPALNNELTIDFVELREWKAIYKDREL